ncbi:MAG TPA: aminotransferase class V-fold PLP-dependent enzyme [Planctomycetes bacterium]|nr:aminotransferase class V-fold PLP-dependent enzyme [Planctomycetota bacterium]
MDRREFLGALGGAAGAMLLPGAAALAREKTAGLPAGADPSSTAGDEDFWASIRLAFDVDRSIVNLNSGGYSNPPRVVSEALQRRRSFAALARYHYSMHLMNKNREEVRRKVARLARTDPSQVALVRNTTEAMCLVFYGTGLKRGDQVLASSLEYPGMVQALRQLSARRGVELVRFRVPLPPKDPAEIVESFRRALGPKVRMVLVSHMTFPNGQIMPVREICRLARERGVLSVVDGAHSFAHVGPPVGEIGCDFYGTSFYKWLCAPMGVGMLWMRKERIPTTWPLFYAEKPRGGDIRKFEHYGSHSIPAVLGAAEAVSFHEAVGGERKRARLHYLKKYWTDRVSGIPGLKLVSNPDPAQTCAMAAFTIRGYKGSEIYSYLWNKHRIVVTPIGPEFSGFDGIRVSPNIYNTTAELDEFLEALRRLPPRKS